ncbi:hypothetical protein ACFLZ0_02310 [Patescibacteria group bacterium]
MSNYTDQLAKARTKDRKDRIESITDTTLPESQISSVEFILIGIVALIDDALDYLGIGLLTFRFFGVCTATILGFWCVFRLKKFPTARFATTFISELIPFWGDFCPTWTIFVVWIYAEQRGHMPKIKMLNKLIEK